MPTTETVEYLGGPLNGRIEARPGPGREVRVPVMPRLLPRVSFDWSDLLLPDPFQEIHTHKYERTSIVTRAGHRLYVWWEDENGRRPEFAGTPEVRFRPTALESGQQRRRDDRTGNQEG